MKPLRFREVLKRTLWGGEEIVAMKGLQGQCKEIGESWEISGVPGDETLVTEGECKGLTLAELIAEYKEKLLGTKHFQRFGTSFPLLIKFISTARPLSVQVHPNDEIAHRMGHPYGKTEMWYIVKTQPDSSLYLGFNHDFSEEELVESLENGTLSQHLSFHRTVPGDCFFIPAGRIHNIGAGNMVVEIQQNSNDTFRVYDFDRVDVNGRKRQLHVAQARAALNYKAEKDYRQHYEPKRNEPVELVDCPAFTTRLIQADQFMEVDYQELDSFVIYIAYEGAARLEDGEGNSVDLVGGQSVMFPAQNNKVKIFPDVQGTFSCLETFIK